MLSSLTFTSDPELKLSESFSLIQHLIDRATEAIFCIDAQARFCYINDSACSLIGYPRQKLLEMSIDEVELNFLPSDWSYYWQLIEQKASLNFKTSCSWQDDRTLDITINFLEHNSQGLACILARPISSNIAEVFSPQKLSLASKNKQLLSSNKSSSLYPSSPQLKPIFEFIEKNYHLPITLNDVAEAVGYSPAYLTNLVKRRTKRTIINWILERRMLEARSLLITTNRSITEIAINVGFTDAYYFSRRFSQYHKISPRSWRQKHQLQSA